MDKKIAFFTEMQGYGKVLRNHFNMKTMEAWISALDAMHIPLFCGYSPNVDGTHSFDLGIVVVPKNYFKNKYDKIYDVETDSLYEYIKNIVKPSCKKIAIMQEGPHEYFQDFNIDKQLWYFQMLEMVDFLLCHNEYDINYFMGLTGKDTYALPSLMITDLFTRELNVFTSQDAVMIGGNFCSWYGGFDSWMVAREMQVPIYAPSMGRKQKDEEQLISEIKYLPYYNWYRWNIELRKMRYGVHLMRTYAAGTFALNCAYWGIPCIGYVNLDTQRLLHPYLTVKEGDINEAMKLARMLKNDKDFYDEQSIRCKKNYDAFYSEDAFNNNFNKILTDQLI